MGLRMVAVGGCRVYVCHEKLETHVVVTCHVHSVMAGLFQAHRLYYENLYM